MGSTNSAHPETGRLIVSKYWRRAVESYVADQERMLAEIRLADRQVKSGHYIKQDEMKAWLLSWGTDRELPPPKCVCGKNHDAEAS